MTATRDCLAVVSGGTGGIGSATVQALCEAGFGVLALGRSDAALDGLTSALGGSGLKARTAICDVGKTSDIAGISDLVRGIGARSTVLVNNAGTLGPIGRFGDSDIGAWCHAIDVNLSGAARLTHALLHALGGDASAVINISSGASATPMAGWSTYCASKAGLAMLTRMLHLEYGEQFPTYGFQPGLVDTDMQSRIRDKPTNAIGDIARSDLLPPEDPGRIIAWLATDCPRDLAGTEFRADNPEIRRRAGLAI